MKKPWRQIQQVYLDESLNCEVTQYAPDPEEWPKSRTFFYFEGQKKAPYPESDDDWLAEELGGTFVNEKRRD